MSLSERMRYMNMKRFAIIDIGSNSIRLVITELDSQGRFKELHNVKKVARLSTHLNEADELTETGINRLIETLLSFKEMMNFHEVAQIATVGTQALRQAENQQAIVELISDMLGINIRILSEYEEAYYGYLAVVNSTAIETGFTIDIGGGSTEVTYYENRELKHYHSFPFGAITLQSEFIKGEEASKDELESIKEYVLGQFREHPWLKDCKSQHVIGIGGSARNVSLVHQHQREYPLGGLHQYEMSAEELHDTEALLSHLSLSERQSLDGLSKDRADIIVPAAIVMTTFLEYTEADTFVMSRRGLRDGLLYEEMLRPMETDRFPVVVEESFHQLSHDYDINLFHVTYITTLASKLYHLFKDFCPVDLEESEALTLLKYSAKVLYIGEFINKEASSQNTFYLLTNMTVDGLSHKERLATACISSFKSKSALIRYTLPYKKLITKKQLKSYEFLGSLMKLAYSLNKTGRHLICELGELKENSSSYVLTVYYKHDCSFEQEYALKHKKHLERVINKNIKLKFVPFEL